MQMPEQRQQLQYIFKNKSRKWIDKVKNRYECEEGTEISYTYENEKGKLSHRKNNN